MSTVKDSNDLTMNGNLAETIFLLQLTRYKKLPSGKPSLMNIKTNLEVLNLFLDAQAKIEKLKD